MPRPSTVTIEAPSSWNIDWMHELTGMNAWPRRTRTVHAPQSPSSQTILVPVAPRARSQFARVANTSRPRTSCSRPLMRSVRWSLNSGFDDSVVRVGAAVAEELPRVAHFANLIEVELRGDEGILVALCDREHLPSRIAEVALPVELADVPRSFESDAVDRADEVAVRDGVRRLLELPQILRQAGHRRGGIEHDLRAVQSQLARSLGEVAVVADVDADLRVLRIEHRVAEVAGAEVVLLPEAGRRVRDVVLPVLAEIRAVGVDHGGRVVVDAGRLLFIERDDDDHVVLGRVLLHQLRSRPVGDLLDRLVPARVLFGAEVGSGEDLLHAEDLHAFLARLIDVLQRPLDLRVADRFDALVGRCRERGLDQTGFDDSGHVCLAPGGLVEGKGTAFGTVCAPRRNSTATRSQLLGFRLDASVPPRPLLEHLRHLLRVVIHTLLA